MGNKMNMLCHNTFTRTLETFLTYYAYPSCKSFIKCSPKIGLITLHSKFLSHRIKFGLRTSLPSMHYRRRSRHSIYIRTVIIHSWGFLGLATTWGNGRIFQYFWEFENNSLGLKLLFCTILQLLQLLVELDK